MCVVYFGIQKLYQHFKKPVKAVQCDLLKVKSLRSQAKQYSSKSIKAAIEKVAGT